jgi:RimJ/RimL family protein N-acetyltransferase
MQDGEVRLEPLGSAHLEGLVELGQDPDVQRFTYVPSPWIEGFERRWLERYDQPNGQRAGFAIVDDASGEFLGMAALVKLDRDAREAEAGYIVAPAARGRGLPSELFECLPTGHCKSWASSESS